MVRAPQGQRVPLPCQQLARNTHHAGERERLARLGVCERE